VSHAAVQALISVGGIALTVAVAWLLGFRRAPVIASPDEAADIARHALPGFRPVATTLAPDGRGARVTGSDGRTATIAPLGDRWVVRA
jgi:hypothetical protein